MTFKIAPTTNFNELFYFDGKMKEELMYGEDGSSVYEDLKYREVRFKLETIVREFRNSLGKISSQQAEINDEEKDSLKSLGYL